MLNKEELIEVSKNFLSLVKVNTKQPFRSRTVRKNGFFNHQMQLIQIHALLQRDKRVNIRLRRKERHRLQNIIRTNEINLPPNSKQIFEAIGSMVVAGDDKINKLIHGYRQDKKNVVEYYSKEKNAIHPVLGVVFTKLVNDMRSQGAEIPAEVTEWKNTVMDPLPRDFALALGKCLITLGFSRKELVNIRRMIKIEQERKVDYISLMSFPAYEG